MIEAEWWEYDSANEMEEAVAGDILFIIESALDARGDALIALPTGRLAEPILTALSQARLNWKRVTIIPTDERVVPLTDPMSNVAALARIFLPLGARVIPIVSEAAADPKEAGAAASARLADLKWPPDLVVFTVEPGGVTGGLLPGPDLDGAINAPAGQHAVGLRPDPLPANAPVPRVTLTRSAILSARTLILLGEGAEDRERLQAELDEDADAETPVGRLLAGCETPIDIHWHG